MLLLNLAFFCIDGLKMRFLVLFFFLFSIQVSGQGKCPGVLTDKSEGFYFNPTDQEDPKSPWSNSVSNSAYYVSGYMSAPSQMGVRIQRSMYYRADYPETLKVHERWIVLVHGLGDHSGRMNELAEKYLALGYRVLRVDLLGHGRSLLNSIQEQSYILEDEIDIRAQALVLKQTLKHLKINSAEVVGHSYGGAVALLLGAYNKTITQPSSEIKIHKIQLLAFYAQDIGDWLASHSMSAAASSMTKGIGFLAPLHVSEKLIESLEHNRFTMGQYYSSMESVFRFFGMAQAKDKIVDSSLEKFLYTSYGAYLAQNANSTGIDISNQSAHELIDLQIRNAIAVTRGGKHFNLFHPGQDLPRFHIPIVIITGNKDELVPFEMMKQAKRALEQKGFEVEFVVIEGAGHLLIKTHLNQVFKAL